MGTTGGGRGTNQHQVKPLWRTDRQQGAEVVAALARDDVEPEVADVGQQRGLLWLLLVCVVLPALAVGFAAALVAIL